jgi:hypothetical protein
VQLSISDELRKLCTIDDEGIDGGEEKAKEEAERLRKYRRAHESRSQAGASAD